LEFSFRCVYCLSTETEIGPTDNYGGFEVEHFKPKGHAAFKHLRNYYKNLLWCCHACNRAKGDAWPTSKEEKGGWRLVDPSKEPLGRHIAISGDRLIPVNGSLAGEYMIDVVDLNSKLHVNRRRHRQKILSKVALLQATVESIASRVVGEPSLESSVDQLLQQIASLSAVVGASLAPPWDSPVSCRCV